MIRFLAVFTAILALCSPQQVHSESAPETITIEFSPGNRLDYGDIDDNRFSSIKDSDGNHRYSEEIKYFPTQYTVTDTFFICIQPQQETYRLNGATQNNLQFYESDGTQLYTDNFVDCIVSLCTISDPTLGECVIFDSNNDEDLTNDPVIPYTHAIQETKSGEFDYYYVNTNVECEYYTGFNVSEITLSVNFRINVPNNKNRYYYYRLNLMQVGTAVIEKQMYTIGWPLDNNIELYRSTGGWIPPRLWIDLNRNETFEREDFFKRIDQPFTMLNTTYHSIEYDRFGRYLVFEKLDTQDHPPVTVGLPAPVFSAETLDTVAFDLAAKRGKYVLLDFWGSWCGPCIGDLPFIKEAYAHFGERLQIIGIAADDDRDELESCIIEHDLSWPQIQTSTTGSIPMLYQVSGYPSMFLIGPDGTLIAEGADLRGEYLIPTLEKHIK